MARQKKAGPEDAPDGLRERIRLKLAGITDEDVLEAAHALTHPLYRREDRMTPEEHRDTSSGVPMYRGREDHG